MKNIEKAFLVLFCVLSALWTGGLSAQEKTLAQLQTEFVSAWLVTVEGEARTRTLRIKGAAQESNSTLLLDATYGWTDGSQSAIAASATRSGQRTTLQFTTQAGSQITATETSNGTFDGTFTDKKQTTKAIKIQKISEDELQLKVASAKAARPTTAIAEPAADVPAPCASFFGGWAGTWNHGGFGPQRLWVIGIDTKCAVKYSFRSTDSSAVPSTFRTAEIKNGVLTLSCGNGGTCNFERRGDEIWARYSASGGDSNHGTFQKFR